jgi:hypothetical protein
MSIAPPTAVDAAVAPGETVRWSGAPPTGLRMHRSDALAVPFWLLCGGFAVFWETTAVTMEAPRFFKLFGVAFVGVALYMIVGRFFIDAFLRARTTYAVTDRAAYLIRGGPFPLVRRFAGSALDAVSLELENYGRGTLRFVPAPSLVAVLMRRYPTFVTPLDAFESIGDVQHVCDLVAEAGRTP